MGQAQLIREFSELKPSFPFKKNLEKYGIAAPESMPLYQAEYLYKYARSAEILGGVSDIQEYANKKAKELFSDFPWVSMKYEDALEKPQARERQEKYNDGTIIFNEHYQKWEGYLGEKVISRASSAEKVKMSMEKYHKITVFNIIR